MFFSVYNLFNTIKISVLIVFLICTNNLLVEALSGSALTLQETSNWAVEEATCFADDISFSSLDIPWTRALADSTRLCVAAATRRDADIRPSDHWPSSELVKGLRLTYVNRAFLFQFLVWNTNAGEYILTHIHMRASLITTVF